MASKDLSVSQLCYGGKMELTLEGKRYVVLDKEAINLLNTNKPTRPLVDKHNKPIPAPRRIKYWEELSYLNVLEQDFPRSPDPAKERKVIKDWFVFIGPASLINLSPALFSVIALLFGLGVTLRLGLMVPIWILALVWLLYLFMHLFHELWGNNFRKRYLHRLFVLSLAPAATGLLWPIMPIPWLRSFGMVSVVCSACIYSLLLIRFLIVYFKYTRTTAFRNMNNASPLDALTSFYDLLKHRPRSEDERVAHQEAAQYLESFRRATCIESADPKEDLKWSEDSTFAGKSLFHFGSDLVATSQALACVGNRWKNFSLIQAVLLKSASVKEPLQLLAYCAIDSHGAYEEWASPMPDWDVKLGEHTKSQRIYDRKILIQYEDGWFIKNGNYEKPSHEEIELLKSAGLLK